MNHLFELDTIRVHSRRKQSRDEFRGAIGSRYGA